MALGYMGPVARSAVDSLIVALKFDEDIVKVAAAEALGKIGPAPGHRDIIALIKAVQNEHDVVREVAGQSLLKLGDPCIPHLIRQMRRGTPEARIALVRILGQLGENAYPAVASLSDCLRLWQGAALHEVIRTIGKIGPKAEATIPELIELFKREQEPQVQALISDTLLVFENKIIPSLIPLLNFPKENVQKNASSILQKLGDAVFPHMVDIVEKSEDEDLICIAIEILSENIKSLPILLNNLKHESNKIRQAVIQALAKTKEPAIEGIVKIMVKTKISYEQEACSSALAEMGVIAVNPLVQVLNESENQSARLAAIESLFKIGFEAKDAIDSLIEAIKKRQGKEQVQVARCLGNMGEIAIPHLLKLLEEKDKSIRQSVIFALAETKSEDAVHYLLGSLEKNPELLSLIVNAMLKLKGIAVPILISSLSHKNEYIRFASAASLAEIANPQAIANLARQSTQEEKPMIRYILQIALRNCQETIKGN